MHLLTFLICIETSNVNPDQTGAIYSGSTLFDKEVSKPFQQTKKQTPFGVIVALRVKPDLTLDLISVVCR